MREILFRGKRIDNGEWITSKTIVHADDDVFFATGADAYGDYDSPEGVTSVIAINAPFLVKVDPNTVGQFTGLFDMNGTKIFEGDILRYECEEENYKCDNVAFFSNSESAWMQYEVGCEENPYQLNPHFSCEDTVVGNRWDNPELMEVSK